MIHIRDARRLGVVVGFAVLLVGATPAPNTGQYGTPVTPPPKLVLSDSIQFDGPQFCKLTSDVSDRDPNSRGAPAFENAGPMNCRITAHQYGPTYGTATISVPGDPNEAITFKYQITGTTVTAGGTRESEGASSYPASITGTMHGVPGSPTFYGNIKVWEPSTAP